MTRSEHMAWCKQRANEYLAKGDIANGVASMLSDLGKHPETAHAGETMALIAMMTVEQGDLAGAKRFVDGFN